MVRNALFGHRLYIVVGEFNNKKGFFGKCLKPVALSFKR
jgi:hypothetical protein